MRAFPLSARHPGISRAFLLSAAAFLALAVILPVIILIEDAPGKFPASANAVGAALALLVAAGICLIGSTVANYRRIMASFDAWLADLVATRRANGGAR